ncbi:MAG: UDP-N-acetylmuramoylalanyl-D-glutamyl-2,6-diaminopimelate--D-alanyl-D-alanine ligase [Micropepsaceae bacterium]
MVSLWTLKTVADAVGGACGTDADVGGISIDTRTVNRGDLFVALKDVRDGHDFVADALAKGAAAALVSRDVAGAPSNRLIKVDDTLQGLEALGRARRAAVSARVAAVTGSVGKTSTKEALRHLLSLQAATHASAASYNNLWGVPLSIARMPLDARYGIFEIGMNHSGEITPLVAQARPHVAIVTMVAAVHLEHFSSVAEIADAKGEIFSGLEPGGVAVINGDLEWTERLVGHARKSKASRIIIYGRKPGCDIRLLEQSLHEDTSDVTVEMFGKSLKYSIGAPGDHWVLNSLGVLGVISALGADAERAASDMSSLNALAGRGARERLKIATGNFDLIDESYNANPLSMASAIATLGRAAPGQGGRRIAILGDMLELGPTGGELHAGIAAPLRQHGIDLLFACGPLMRHLWENVAETQRGGYAGSSTDIAEAVAQAIRPGDVVMIKGSYGSKMRVVVDAVRALSSAARS